MLLGTDAAIRPLATTKPKGPLPCPPIFGRCPRHSRRANTPSFSRQRLRQSFLSGWDWQQAAPWGTRRVPMSVRPVWCEFWGSSLIQNDHVNPIACCTTKTKNHRMLQTKKRTHRMHQPKGIAHRRHITSARLRVEPYY